MILNLLLISSLAIHAFAVEVSVINGVLDNDVSNDPSSSQGIVTVERDTDSNSLEASDIEGSGEEGGIPTAPGLVEGSGLDDEITKLDEKSWEDVEKEMDWDQRRKRQTAEDMNAVQQPPVAAAVQEPVALAQRGPDDDRRGHGSNSDNEDREESGRHPHRPDRPDRPSCNTVRCTSGTECIMENGRPTCRPIRPEPSRSCRDINCPRDSRCRMERDPRCRDRHCPDQPVCVRESRPSCRNVQCPFGTICHLVEDQFCRHRDCPQVISCVPVSNPNSCQRVSCPVGTLCRMDGSQPTCVPVVIDQCMHVRCAPGFQCRTVDNQPRCFPTTPFCGPNQVFAQCSSPCEPRCGQSFPTFCPNSCNPPRCQCAQGFWRHANGSCVEQRLCFFR